MPFKSKAQQRFMFAKHPAIAKEFASEMSPEDFKNLPGHVGSQASGGHFQEYLAKKSAAPAHKMKAAPKKKAASKKKQIPGY